MARSPGQISPGNYPDEQVLTSGAQGRENLGVPVAEKHDEQDKDALDAKLLVSALFASSGAVAPVDFARFGKRVGEIIARSGNSGGSRRSPYNSDGR